MHIIHNSAHIIISLSDLDKPRGNQPVLKSLDQVDIVADGSHDKTPKQP